MDGNWVFLFHNKHLQKMYQAGETTDKTVTANAMFLLLYMLCVDTSFEYWRVKSNQSYVCVAIARLSLKAEEFSKHCFPNILQTLE